MPVKQGGHAPLTHTSDRITGERKIDIFLPPERGDAARGVEKCFIRYGEHLRKDVDFFYPINIS